MKTLLVLAVALCLGLPAVGGAHPGHGEVKMMSGRVVAVQAARIQIEFFDRTSFTTKRAWVLVDGKTKITAGKTRLALTDLKPQQEIECLAETVEGKDGTTELRAAQLRLKQNSTLKPLRSGAGHQPRYLDL